jgi:hypothetical protein
MSPSSDNVRRMSVLNIRVLGFKYTASWPPNINPTDEPNTPLIYAAISAKCSDDGHATAGQDSCCSEQAGKH